MRNLYLRKDATAAKRGEKGLSNLDFTPATPEELKKALDGADAPEGYVAGWASTPDLDSYNHKVLKGAFSEAIAKRGLRGPSSIKLLIGHNWEKLAGEIKVLEYRGNRLWIEAQLALDIGYVSDAYKAAKMIGGLNFSVGFMLEDYRWVESKTGPDELIIEKGDLFEVSVVPFPGNEKATMTFIKSAEDGGNPPPLNQEKDLPADVDDLDEAPNTIAEFEKALVASGLVKSRNDARSVTRAVKAASHLFTTKAKAEDDSPAPQTGPVLDMDAVTSIAAKIADMKKALAPVAQS